MLVLHRRQQGEATADRERVARRLRPCYPLPQKMAYLPDDHASKGLGSIWGEGVPVVPQLVTVPVCGPPIGVRSQLG